MARNYVDDSKLECFTTEIICFFDYLSYRTDISHLTSYSFSFCVNLLKRKKDKSYFFYIFSIYTVPLSPGDQS